MDDFLQEKPKKKTYQNGYRRLFLLVLAVAVLMQMVLFIHTQVGRYHEELAKDFKIILAVKESVPNETLSSWGESLSAKKDILSVQLFSPQDGWAVLQRQNPRLASALLSLGREPMPAYFEIKIQEHILPSLELFTQNLSAEYPSLMLRYSAAQAQMLYYTGICLQVLRVVGLVALVLFIIFMFLVEAYPARSKTSIMSATGWGLVAGGLSWGIVSLCIFPTGLLVPALQHFTSVGQQIGVIIFSGLLGWTLGKWQRF